MDINLIAPICDTGYGTVGLNLLLALERAGHKVCLYPRGQIEAAQIHGEVIQKALTRHNLLMFVREKFVCYYLIRLSALDTERTYCQA